VVHPLLEVEGRRGQQEIDLVSNKSFEIVPRKPVIGLEMSDDRFDGRPSSELLAFLLFLVLRISFEWGTGNVHKRISCLFLSSISPIANRFDDRFASMFPGIGESRFKGFGVVLVLLVRAYPNDDIALSSCDNGSLGAVFVLLVILAFGDGVDMRLVQSVDLGFVFLLLVNHFLEQLEGLPMNLETLRRKLSCQIPHQDPGDRSKPLHGGLGFLNLFGMAEEA